MKVLHVVESLDRGAVENWLLRMLGHAREGGKSLDWSFYTQLDRPGQFDDLARALGARVVQSPVPLGETCKFMGALRRELREGNYDVLHCHHDILSAIYLASSAGLPLSRRIVHVHNADDGLPTPSQMKRALLRSAFRKVCFSADRIVGISEHTLDSLLKGRGRKPGRDKVHYYGVDPEPFVSASREQSALRRELGLDENVPIMLFAGRMTQEKNPVFAVDVMAALRRRMPQVHGVFAGAGALEQAARSRAMALGQEGYVHFLGWRQDIPELMIASDWFILPRPEEPLEGFGLAVVESQLAGLRLLMSHGVPDAPLLPTAKERRLSLADDPDKWADAAVALWNGPAPSRDETLAALQASPMNMDFALADLLGLYL